MTEGGLAIDQSMAMAALPARVGNDAMSVDAQVVGRGLLEAASIVGSLRMTCMGNFVQAMCGAMGKLTSQQRKFDATQAQSDREVLEVKMEVAEIRNEFTDRKHSVAKFQATTDAFAPPLQPAAAAFFVGWARLRGVAHRVPRHRLAAVWGHRGDVADPSSDPCLSRLLHLERASPPSIEKHICVDLVGTRVPKTPQGGTTFGIKFTTHEAAAEFRDFSRDDPFKYPGPDGSEVVLAYGPPK